MASSGTCGDNVTWMLSDDGVFTLSGSGATYDLGSYLNQEWHDDVASITSIVVENGITHIGDFLFSEAINAVSVSLPETVTSIGFRTFMDTGLTEVHIPKNVNSITIGAFSGTMSLVKFTVDEENPKYFTVDDVLFSKFQGTEDDGTSYTSYVLECYPKSNPREEYYLPDGVRKAYFSDFAGAKYLKKVIMSQSLLLFSTGTSGANKSIETMEMRSTEPPELFLQNAAALSLLTTIIVPYGTGDKYKATEGWSDYAAIIVEAENKKFPLMQFILGLLSELTPGVKREPIAYLYNGVQLPPLPEWDRKMYPYATISIISTMTALTVTLTFRKSWEQDVQLDIPKDAIWTQPGDIEYKIKKSGYYPSIDSVKDADWGEPIECTEATWMSATNIRWTSNDIVSQGSIGYETGELILAASEPVPVYE